MQLNSNALCVHPEISGEGSFGRLYAGEETFFEKIVDTLLDVLRFERISNSH